MKKLCTAVIASVLLWSCNENKKTEGPITVEEMEIADIHTSYNSLDWTGVYTGVLPCADCEGIETTIELRTDNTYVLHTNYLGEKDAHFKEEGFFVWTAGGSSIVLERAENEVSTSYKVGENRLIQLDVEGNTITGELADLYVLRKE